MVDSTHAPSCYRCGGLCGWDEGEWVCELCGRLQRRIPQPAPEDGDGDRALPRARPTYKGMRL